MQGFARVVGVLVASVVTLAGCGGSSDPSAAVGTTSAQPGQAVDGAVPGAPGLPGCEVVTDAAPELADVLAETVRTDGAVGPAVLTDDDLGGQTLTVTLVLDGGETYRPVSWAVEDTPDGPQLLPLTERAVAVSPPDADTSRVVGADDAITLGDTPGTGGMALGQDCSLVLAQEQQPPPPPPAPEVRDDLIEAAPDRPAPGDLVELTFPAATGRGVAFQLDERVDGEWVTRWWMTSDGNGGDPTTVPVGTGGYGTEDVGIGGPGPDRVLLHPDTTPGEYRLCTANAGEDFCTLIEVTPSG